MPSPTPSEMVETLETALQNNAGVVSVTVDGTTVRYDRAQAMKELDYWRRRAARQQGRRPRVSSISLRSF